MPKPPDIAPALTPDEWASMDHPYTLENAVEGYAVTWNYPQTIALANAALHDDSPYKITRADVHALEEIAEYMDDMFDPKTTGRYCAARQLAAKLAALLPPENT